MPKPEWKRRPWFVMNWPIICFWTMAIVRLREDVILSQQRRPRTASSMDKIFLCASSEYMLIANSCDWPKRTLSVGSS